MPLAAHALPHTALPAAAEAHQQQHQHQRQQQAALPATYRRLVARRCGDSFRAVAEVQGGCPMPTAATAGAAPLQEGEVLVRVHYAGVNGGCETFRARGEHA